MLICIFEFIEMTRFSQVKQKAAEIAILLQVERFATKKELTRMTQLTAECSKIFPPDFASIDRDEIMRQVSFVLKP